MQYLSLAFADFVAVLLPMYYALPRRWNLRWLILLGGSLFFYGCFGLQYLPFLLFTGVTVYICGRLMEKSKRKKLLLILCAGVNLGIWFAVKVLPWALDKGNWQNISMPSLPVAVGISYFTLQAVGYLADVCKGKLQPERNLGKFLLFVSFFPGIIQGPISRYDRLMPELTESRPFREENLFHGVVLILLGLVKKMVIADRLAPFVAACFGGYRSLQGGILYLGAVGFALQLYLDFSGCVDLCRGVSRLFGIRLTENFNRPYLATSIKDFWGKWHMSLSSWLKDYVYIPLGGNRKGKARKYINLMLTFLVSGLWHGAGFQFFLWGILHGGYQILGELLMPIREKCRKVLKLSSGSLSHRIVQTVITFQLVTVAWIFFRADGLREGLGYLQNMLTPCNLFAWTGQIGAMGIDPGYFPVLITHLCLLFGVEIGTKSQESAVAGILRQHGLLRWSFVLLLLLDVILLGAYGSGYSMSGFLYGGF